MVLNSKMELLVENVLMNNIMERENGYYWIKLFGNVKHWMIAYYDYNKKWYYGYTVIHPVEIDEKQIIKE